jgi:hypothetical protein
MIMDHDKIKIGLREIERLYTEGIAKYGLNSQSVGWKDEESQNLRFKKLVELVDDKDEFITVNELGCGYGAMFDFFKKSNFNISHYRGYDISKKMIENAKKFIDDKRAEFIHGDKITKIADYCFASGIFNVKFDVNDNLWQKYMEHILYNMNEYSQRGFSFNVLTTYVDYKKDHLYYADPLYYFDFCKRNFTKNVSLLHDYELFEWTIICRKGAHAE